MANLSVCRVCLGEDIRLVSIVGTPLQEMYDSLVLLPFVTEDGRPILVCYICRAKLKNCYELRKSCVQSEELFTQMLSCSEPEQVKLPGIYNEKRFYVKNVIHLSMVHELGMDADIVGVEALKCEVKDEPNDGEVISENVLEESSIPDDVLPADSDTKNEESMAHVLYMDADSVAVETLVVLCDVKDEQSDPGDVDEYVLEESNVADGVPSADSHDDFLITVKEQQIGHMTSESPPSESTQDVQRTSEHTTSSNLNEHKLVQDTFKKLDDVTSAGFTDYSKEITASVKYTYDTCQQSYSSKCELERHISLYTNEWKQDLSRENTTSAHTHTAQKPYQCKVCNKRYSSIRYLKDHLRTHIGVKPHHCGTCNKQFFRKATLTSHMLTHTSEKPHHCDICKKQFLLKCALTRHMRTHTGEKSYHCNNCEIQFLENSSLMKHMRTHTGEKPFHCNICNKQFSKKGTLNSHMLTHTGEKPYHCDICKKQFSIKGNLNVHMRAHTGDKPYHCDICKKQFSMKGTLNLHIRTHTGEKPYHCNKCEKQFARTSYLTIHMRTHTDKKLFHCNICNKQFSKKGILNSHMLTHTKPYHCDICKKQFARKSYLTIHMRTHTGKIPHNSNI